MQRMRDFFSARVDGYEQHMLTEAQGCKEAYQRLAELVPANAGKILDLGCGTGLELDEIFRRLPHVSVVGIDLTQAMLDKLRQKPYSKNVKLVCGDFFAVDFGENAFDTAISFQSMHHFSYDQKIGLYTRIHGALMPNGMYIECDYMVVEQALEDRLYAHSAELRRKMDIPHDAL